MTSIRARSSSPSQQSVADAHQPLHPLAEHINQLSLRERRQTKTYSGELWVLPAHDRQFNLIRFQVRRQHCAQSRNGHLDCPLSPALQSLHLIRRLLLERFLKVVGRFSLFVA